MEHYIIYPRASTKEVNMIASIGLDVLHMMMIFLTNEWDRSKNQKATAVNQMGPKNIY